MKRLTSTAGLAFVIAAVLAPTAHAQTTANERISIHKTEIRFHEPGLHKALVVRIEPAGSTDVDLKIGVELQARAIDVVLTNVHIEGEFRGGLTALTEWVRHLRQLRQQRSTTSDQPVSP